ncbi:MAG: VWA domain-containing protein [Gammaproteobacteria bacterium]|nr:VWA domain-containing protein [Gammaproteobacteria bacterium]
MTPQSIYGNARAGKFIPNLLGFARALRVAGVPVDTSKVLNALQAVAYIDIAHKDDFALALQSSLIQRHEDLAIFDQMFALYFKDRQLAQQLMGQLLPKNPSPSTAPKQSRVWDALRPQSTASKNPPATQTLLDLTMTASQVERLRQADFQHLTAQEYQIVEHWVKKIKWSPPIIPSRRKRASTRSHDLDWQRAIQNWVQQDGDLFHLPTIANRNLPAPVVFLIDVSGSMHRYTRMLLVFLHQATRYWKNRRVFSIGTQLSNLQWAFAKDNPDEMLKWVNLQVKDYAGGTQLSTGLKSLRQKYPIQHSKTIFILISDGLDTGEKSSLHYELASLHAKIGKFVWLNPLLRYDQYQPSASGASVLFQYADQMLAVHNLEHLENLARALSEIS